MNLSPHKSFWLLLLLVAVMNSCEKVDLQSSSNSDSEDSKFLERMEEMFH